MPLGALAYRHRLAGKRAVTALSRVLPAAASQRLRALAERVAFNLTPQYQGDTLPGIFGYWSRRHLSPDAQRLGIGSPEALYLRHILRHAATSSAPVRVLSLGCGAASMEIALAEHLREAGVPARITCVDFNPSLLRSATREARSRELGALMVFVDQDCNLPFDLGPQEVIIVNQFFHHVTSLETFCASLRQSLVPKGVLISSDIVGRNGHQLWPDVESRVQQFWQTLPEAKRFDRYYDAVQPRYRSVDHSAYSNEGVRAQDVVGCLLAEFDFELFFGFGGAVIPFIERRVGFNFDANNADDCALIDAVHADDAAALSAGRYPAANMIAVLRHKGTVVAPVHEPVSPERHVALTREQLAKTVQASR
jgi:SAM-dependent methyltransferase